MKNNVYVRSNSSICSISLTRIILILPMIIYGLYKNGVFLYRSGFVDLFTMFRPFIIILGSAIIGALVNIIYEYGIKKNDEDLLTVIFSSFHVEYGVLVACVMSININLIIYFSVLAIIFMISKFLKNHVNIICVTFILIYILQNIFDEFIFANAYETSASFSLEFMDYLIGRGAGGIASTHIIFLALAMFGLAITNNNKTNITVTTIITYITIVLVYSLITSNNFSTILYSNNYLFIATMIATDSVTSCYTSKGMIIYGALIGVLSFVIYLLNPILAPFIAILIVSLFNNLIDRKSNSFANGK